MVTDVPDEQSSHYESNRVELTNESSEETKISSNTTSMSTTNSNRRHKYSTQSNSIHTRHSGSSEILSLLRSFAMKPFKTSSMTNAVAGGQTSNVISGSYIHNKTSVNLLRYRPLSDVVNDHVSYTQFPHAVEQFLQRMEWPVNGLSNEARLKWNTAMKFLIPVKFDVHRALNLYKTHENLRKKENLDHISINNPHLIQEIQSNKCFSLPPVENQPLVIIYSASDLHNQTNDRELIILQALICQLDVATESIEVQEKGLNFICDMQNCSASQFDINFSKKILKLLQGGYPAMVKKIFIISPPKWFKIAYQVILYSPDQMREYLTREYNYSLDNIPINLGGTFDPLLNGNVRYEICLSTVTNIQSICSIYYINDIQQLTTNNILSCTKDHHNQEKLRPKHEISSQIQMRKRESSLSIDYEKRQRSNKSLIGQEISINNSSSFSRKENLDDQLKQDENRLRILNDITERNVSKPLNEDEFLSKNQSEIRQEFREIPNPSAKETSAATDEKNLHKNRYRDVLPGESTRVKLQPDIDVKNDFINANYVSGYKDEEKAYIFTQGPLQSTVKDFWRMIWQENISIIVMTTNIREAGTTKCFPYWPSAPNEYLTAGLYHIQNDKFDEYESFVITKLLLQKKNCSDIRTIYHAHYLKWPDHGVPLGTKDALLFLEKVEDLKQLTMTKSPILLHCSAGIGRTGTFCAIDIGIKRYLNEKLIDIPSTVIQMREERAGSVQTEDQYLFVHLALKDFIEQYRSNLNKTDCSQLNNSKISFNSNHVNISPLINRREPSSSRFKTLSDSSTTAVRHLITPTDKSNRQRSSMPTTTINGINRKVRK